jgi:hypothetical protein
VKWNAEELRAKYAYRPLAERLAYERKREFDKRHQPAAASLTEAAKESLDAQESSFEIQRRFDLRTRALAELHSDHVQQFISREGFGLARLPTPAPEHLDLPEARPLQFASVSSDAIRHEGAGTMPIPAALNDRGDAPQRLPSLSMLSSLHTASKWNFLNVSAWGVVKNKKQVAGFAGHGFRDLPLLVEPRESKDDERGGEPDPKHPWHVTRLELVSLLKHDRPAVYVTERLPRMTDLDGAKARGLSDFEAKGLASLRAGDELAADATLNRIRMLGAVRASKQCLDCHEAQRGDLLGAFSYELRRDPPVKPVRKPAA